MTKREKDTIRRAYNDYCNSSKTSLFHAYKQPSNAKLSAFDYIRREMVERGGRGLRVISHTMQIFTCGYVMETVSGLMFVYHTPSHRYCVYVSELD